MERKKLGEELGRGSFGVVWKAINLHTGSLVAIKQMKAAQRDHLLEDAKVTAYNTHQSYSNMIEQKEMALLTMLKHSNVVQYLGSFDMERKLHLVLEFVEGGSLHHTLSRFGVFPERLARVFTLQVDTL
jgi:serine/threonine protein kinase